MKKFVINKNDLKNNINVIKKMSDKAKVYAVVKCNGYGLGIVEYTKFLIENGINDIACAQTEELIKLVDAGVKANFIMLSPVVNEEELQFLIENDIILTIGAKNELEEAIRVSKKINHENVKCYIKIDTGFSRYGFLYNKVDDVIDAFKNRENIQIVGIYTHFSNVRDKGWTQKQFDRLINLSVKIKEAGFDPGIMHCSESGAFVKYPYMNLDAVRIGTLFLGRSLFKTNKLKRIGKLETEIVEIKDIPKGSYVGYSSIYRTFRETKVAVIPVGYEDGFNRNKLRDDFSFRNNLLAVGREFKKIFIDNSLKVEINGKKYRVIGRIGMFYSIIDITGSEEIHTGDKVLIDISPIEVSSEIRREYI